ncbi:M15 family metallopeptidase [Nocardia goodfellowii]
MNQSQPARTAPRRRIRTTLVAAAVLVSAAPVGVLVYQSLASLSSSAARSFDIARDVLRPHSDSVTVFDDEAPSVANLDSALRAALRRATTDAADDGVEFVVNSGWRSRAQQEQLLRAAVAEYGSEQAAARWVATPETSAHVSGDAVDLGPATATAWLSAHGAAYGLCQIYDNEPWHYELRPDAVEHGCPPRYADPTADPRMWQ